MEGFETDGCPGSELGFPRSPLRRGCARRPERPPAASAADSFPVATAARLGGDESHTRFVMDFSRKIDLHAFTLADPYRVVVDIPQVTFQLPPKTGESGRGLIKAFRFGLVMPGGSRMVFDLAKPVRIEKASVIEAAEARPGAPGARSGGHRSRELFAQDRARPTGWPARNCRRADRPQATSGDPRPLVVLDPGHGGIDTGTKAPSGELEKDIVLELRASACATASKKPANTAC